MTPGDHNEATRREKTIFYLESAAGEIGHSFDFTIIYNSKCIVVTISPDSLPEGRILTLISEYSRADDDDVSTLETIEKEILDIIYSAGWRKFEEFAPTTRQEPVQEIIPIGVAENLQLDLNRETFNFKLVEIDGKAELVEFFPAKPGSHFLVVEDTSLGIPRYSSRDIKTISKLPTTGFIAKVSVGGVFMCCKIATASSLKAVQREYDYLSKVMLAETGARIPVPKLLGLVVDDNEAVIGILEEFIEHDLKLSDIFKGDSKVSKEQADKWIEQITSAVENLHDIDVVWGDGKPENILIDSAGDNCILIDFGGSQTDDWVDKEWMETRAGDNQAIGRICEFLRKGLEWAEAAKDGIIHC